MHPDLMSWTPLRRYLGSRRLRAVALLLLGWGVYVTVFGMPGEDAFLPYRIDLDVYRLGAQVFRDGGDLYGVLPDTRIGANLPFTYPPLAAVLFVPLTWMPLQVANAVFSLGSVAVLFGVVATCVRDGFAASRGEAAWLAVALTSALVWLVPVRETIEFGQVNVYLMGLVVADILLGRGRWWRGSLTGLALAIKLTPAVFLAWFLVRGDWRGLATGVGSALAGTGVGFLLAPAASAQYWGETLRDPTRIGELTYVSNQSLNGLLHRLPLGPATTVAWFALCAVIGIALLAVMWRLFGLGLDAVAMVCMGIYALLASPVSWAHHWVWAAPALVTLLAWANRESGPRRGLLAAVAAAAVATFYSRGIWHVPNRDERELQWTWWQQVVGNSYVLWGLLFVLATALLVTWRRAGTPPRPAR